jgi:hypothetical protein
MSLFRLSLVGYSAVVLAAVGEHRAPSVVDFSVGLLVHLEAPESGGTGMTWS